MNKKIKIFLTDIDGVWTDNGMYYDDNGTEFKKFNTSDSYGVIYCQLLNIKIGIITGENSHAVKRRADKLKIEHCFLGINNKVKVTEQLLKSLKISWEEVAYIGDDINDIRLINKVGLSACPKNAQNYIKNNVDWVLTTNGGEGAFRHFVEKYLEEKGILDSTIEKYIKYIELKQ